MPGLDPGIHLLLKVILTKMMDCRVKPGNDEFLRVKPGNGADSFEAA